MPSTAAMSKPVLPPLQTPKSASFPSEIVSTPMSAHPMSAYVRPEQDLRTPITPPTAYTDFLKALTPILASPPPSALGRSISDDSVTSLRSATSTHSSKSSFSSLHGGDKHLSPTSFSLPPPTPLSASSAGPRSASSNLKRLRIPQHSPIFSPNSARSPYTAASTGSMIYSALSPADWTGRSNFDYISTPRSAVSKPVSVRSVVTRTVTYKRTTPNLEPAPKGKRRKTASAASSVVSEEDGKDNNKEISKDTKPTLVKIEEKEVDDTKQKMPPPPTIAVSPASNSTSMGDSDSSSISSSSTGSP